MNADELNALHKMLTSNVDKSSSPPPATAGRVWAMIDSGSEPNVANCKVSFPAHEVVESEGQRNGLQYKAADGSLIPNQGEVKVQHVAKDGQCFNFTFQHAAVHCPILSVTDLVLQDCWVTFHRRGGYILYPDGRKINCVAKAGVFFAQLNIAHPDVHMRGHP